MKKSLFAGFALAAIVAVNPAFAGDYSKKSDQPGKAAKAEPTPEQRKNMAALHDKMASCLRSDKPAKECRQEMWQGCKEFGKEGCPMMGYMHDKRMKRGDRAGMSGMEDSESSSSSESSGSSDVSSSESENSESSS